MVNYVNDDKLIDKIIIIIIILVQILYLLRKVFYREKNRIYTINFQVVKRF